MKPGIFFNLIKTVFLFFVLLTINPKTNAQYKSFQLNANGDTINAINNAGQKVGKWVIEVPELRGEPGYVEEGIYKKGEKDGYWRRYSTMGDLIALESYLMGGKFGTQQYFNYLGDLEHEENWRAYNPDAPYDTIAIYGEGNGEIVDFKIVKAVPYSVKDGEWRYYEPGSGRVIRTETWDRNVLVNPNAPKTAAVPQPKKDKIDKTPEMLQWEKKNKGKKGVMRDGRTVVD
jgi:hypothetical protein